MKRVYIAGSYSANNVITVLDNMRKGIRLSTEVFINGFSPFCPWLDYQFQLMLREGETLKVEDYYRYSIDWLKVSDAVLVVDGWENSKGTKEEIKFAYQIGIPIFYSLKELLDYNK